MTGFTDLFRRPPKVADSWSTAGAPTGYGYSSSGKARGVDDFNGRGPSSMRGSSTCSSIKARFKRFIGRGSGAPAPGAQVQARQPDLSKLSQAKVLTPQEKQEQLDEAGRQLEQADKILMRAEVEHLLPGLKTAADAQVESRVNALVDSLMALEKQFIGANEYGFTLDRLLGMVGRHDHILDHGKSESADDLVIAVAAFQELVDSLRQSMASVRPAEARREGLVWAEIVLTLPGMTMPCPTEPGKPLKLVVEEAAKFPMRDSLKLSDEQLFGLNPHEEMMLNAGREAAMRQLEGRFKSAYENMPKLVKALTELDAVFRASCPTYAFDRLFSVLCNHARILEAGEDAKRLDLAVDGLLAVVDTVLASIRPRRDGYALNALIGLDNELDAAIVAVRTERLTQFMEDHADREVNKAATPPIPAPTVIGVNEKVAPSKGVDPDDLMATAGEHAEKLVKAECEVARARLRLANAFRRAGLELPVEVLSGQKMTVRLMQALQRKLDESKFHKRAKDVGVAIVGLYLLERKLAESDEAQRLRNDIIEAQGRTQRAEEEIRQDLANDPSIVRGSEDWKAVMRGAYNIRADGAHLKQRLDTLDRDRVSDEDLRLEAYPEIPRELLKAFGLSRSDLAHVPQLERQGLSSMAEARAVLDIVRARFKAFVKSNDAQKLEAEGFFEILKTRREEDRAADLPKRMLRPYAAVALNPASPNVTRDAIRAAILHVVAKTTPDDRQVRQSIVREALKAKGFPAQRPSLSEVRRQLVDWGVRDFLDPMIAAMLSGKEPPEVPSVNAVRTELAAWGIQGDEVRRLIVEQLQGGVTAEKLANWSWDANLPAPAVGADESAETLAAAAADVSRSLLQGHARVSVALPPPDEAAMAQAARASALHARRAIVRAAILEAVTRAPVEARLTVVRKTIRNLRQNLGRAPTPGEVREKLVRIGLHNLDHLVAAQLARQGLVEMPRPLEVRAILAEWGVQGDFDAVITEQLAGGVSTATIAAWSREMNLPAAPAGSGDTPGMLVAAAGALSQTLVQAYRQGAFAPPADADRVQVVRASILHQFAIQRANVRPPAPKVAPTFDTLKPNDDRVFQSIRQTLREWGIAENLDEVIRAQLGDGITAAKVAVWVEEAGLQQETVSGTAGRKPAATPEERAIRLSRRLVRLLTGSYATRSAMTLPPGDIVAARHAVRAAILEQAAIPPSHTLTPSTAAVRKTLRDWGIQDDLLDLINKELKNGGITQKKLTAWEKDAATAESRKGFVDSLADPKIGTRVKVASSDRLDLQAGVMGSILGINPKLSAGKTEQIGWERPVDTFMLLLGEGAEFGTGMDLTAPLLGSALFKAGPFFTFFGSAQGMSGVELRCAKAEHMQALTETLLKKSANDLATERSVMDRLRGRKVQSSIGFEDLALVESIMPVREVRGAVDGGLGAQVALGVSNEDPQDGDPRTMLSMGVRAAVHAGPQGMAYEARNNKGFVKKKETATVRRAAVTGWVGAQVAPQGDPDHKVSVPGWEKGIKIEGTEKSKAKVFVGDDNRLRRGTEIVDQVYAKGAQSADELVGAIFKRSRDRMAKMDPASHQAVIEVLDSVGRNEMQSIASPLDDDVWYFVDTLRAAARAYELHKRGTGTVAESRRIAHELHAFADLVLADHRNYDPGRIGAIPMMETATTTTRVNLLFAAMRGVKTTTAEGVIEERKWYAPKEKRQVAKANREVRLGLVDEKGNEPARPPARGNRRRA